MLTPGDQWQDTPLPYSVRLCTEKSLELVFVSVGVHYILGMTGYVWNIYVRTENLTA